MVNRVNTGGLVYKPGVTKNAWRSLAYRVSQQGAGKGVQTVVRVVRRVGTHANFALQRRCKV